MIFNSLEFAIFFPIIFFLYWFPFNKTVKFQNSILLFASIFFYCFANWKFIFLLTFSGAINFFLAKFIAQKEEGTIRKLLFYFGLLFNVGILLYFKYLNFFVENFISLFKFIGFSELEFTPLHLLLPLGISFFTFQLIGYLIDIYNQEINPYNDLLIFFTYLLYFPKILSGPIERAQQFIPQIQKKRIFNYDIAINGLKQFLWGLFKKIVIANHLTSIVDIIFSNYQNLQGSVLFFGGIAYAIGLYADFSGFTDMACGTSKLFNIKITNNFAFPFFSTNISDFWRKWHISLTSWMMDYIFTPLNFLLRKYKKIGLSISIIITFLLVGLWHGANWTFIIFGLIHGLYFIPLIIKGTISKNRIVAKDSHLPSFNELTNMLGLFLIVAATTIIFRASTITVAYNYFKIIFSKSLFSIPNTDIFSQAGIPIFILIFLVLIFSFIEWFGRDSEYAIENLPTKWNKTLRWGFYYLLILTIIIFNGDHQQFIYFQF